MFARIKAWLNRRHDERRARDVMRSLFARYDAAQTNEENRRHWASADSLSAATANSPAVRRTLRNRARYETANNCYANGMVRTIAYHCVGSGPTLKINTGDEAANQKIEREWQKWAMAVNLAAKLRTFREARARDGEAFMVLGTNERLTHPVKLSLRLVECDQFAAPPSAVQPIAYPSAQYADGIHYDEEGNPTIYDMLPYHPGDAFAVGTAAPKPLRAENVIHWYREDRPGQLRGIPEITPALPLYAILRRYTLATLGAAEIAAMMAMFLKTNSNAIDPAEVDPWAALELNRNALTTLPDGWDVSQLKAEQPTTTYDTFTRAVIREIARCLDMPFNVAAGDSSDSSYASGRLDHQTWRRAVDIDRDALQCVALNRIFAAWLDEALLVPNLLEGLPPLASLSHEWHWTPFEHVDPLKEANAAVTLLESGLLSIPTYFAGQGKDWQDEMAKQAECLGMTFDEYRVELRKKLLSPSGTPGGVAASLRQLITTMEESTSA